MLKEDAESYYAEWTNEQLESGIEMLRELEKNGAYRLVMQEIAQAHQQAMDQLVLAKEPLDMYRLQGAITGAVNLLATSSDLIDHMSQILTVRKEQVAFEKTLADRSQSRMIQS